jgi:GNAT superfamily N-acetyltransferase
VTVAIRAARPGDEGVIVELVAELARYERLARAVEASPRQISQALFAANPRVFCDIAEHDDGNIAGFAVWFYTFSTFRGKHGLFLEDLFVRPQYRGQGIGKALISGLARRCSQEGLGRLEWMVLDWNEPAIAFYRSRGAKLLRDWIVCRVDGTALDALGG